jgi:hypothetical protein
METDEMIRISSWLVIPVWDGERAGEIYSPVFDHGFGIERLESVSGKVR